MRLLVFSFFVILFGVLVMYIMRKRVVKDVAAPVVSNTDPVVNNVPPVVVRRPLLGADQCKKLAVTKIEACKDGGKLAEIKEAFKDFCGYDLETELTRCADDSESVDDSS